MGKKEENLPQEGERLLNRYRLISKIGDGPAGYLYKALDMALDIPVAVKIFRKEFFGERYRDINLLRVYRARAYQHESLVKIFEFQEENGWHFITSQLIEGFSLRMIIDFHRETGEYFTIPKIAAFLVNIAESLSFIHKIGIHGNLKPENIFILAERLKLSDPYHLVSDTLKDGEEIPLHEYYRPAEQLHNPLDERHSFDIYSLALIMGEIISNNPVKPAIRLSEQIPHLTGTLDALFMKATAVSADERYKDIEEFKNSLLPALAAIEREGLWIRKYHETGSFRAVIPKATEVEPLKPIEIAPVEAAKVAVESRIEEVEEVRAEVAEALKEDTPVAVQIEETRGEGMILEGDEERAPRPTVMLEPAEIKEVEEISKGAEDLEIIKEEELTDVTTEEVEAIVVEEVEEKKSIQMDDGIEIEGVPQTGGTEVLTAIESPDGIIPPIPAEEASAPDHIISLTKPVEVTAPSIQVKKEKPFSAAGLFLVIALIVIIAGASALIYLKLTSTEEPVHSVQPVIASLESRDVLQVDAGTTPPAATAEIKEAISDEAVDAEDITTKPETAVVEDTKDGEKEIAITVQPVQIEPPAKRELLLAADLECPAGMRKIVVKKGLPKEQFKKTTDLAYCIDPYEYPGKGAMPSTGVSKGSAESACSSAGKRLCTAQEWRRACGAKYSYGSKFVPGKCNTGSEEGDENNIVAAGSFTECKNGYGIYDMIGNAGEWTAEGLVMGGDSRKEPNRCTCGSSTKYRGTSPFIGFRCCADPKK